jgi:ATP-dependent exoDNAse (exonuclease V) alpha subunit
MDSGKEVSFDPRQMRHFDHGYAVTSHSSQGLTSERVLVNMDTEVHPELINGRFAYVSVSRASRDAQIFTNDAANLAERLSKDISKTSAIEFGGPPAPVPNAIPVPTVHPKDGSASGLGLSIR